MGKANPYVALTDKELFEVRKTWGCTDARFWHACNDDGEPRRRIVNNYRAAIVYRNGNDLYFLARNGKGNSAYILPADEYVHVDGDVNVNLSHLTLEQRKLFYDDGGARDWALKHRCSASVLMPELSFESTIDVGRNACRYQPPTRLSKPKQVTTTPKPKQAADTPRQKAKKSQIAKPSTDKKAKAAARSVRKHDVADPLSGVVNPRPQDKSGWKGTRKRRSCVTKRNAYDSSAGCMAIGAMFSRHVA